jgi:hypothetical protein
MAVTPILEFSGNEAYGGSAVGLTIWDLGYPTTAQSMPISTIKNFTAWHLWEADFFSYNIQNVTFDGFVVRGDVRCCQTRGDWGFAFEASDYWCGNTTIQNSDIQGMAGGIGFDTETPGVFTVQNSYFRNYSFDISIQTPSTGGDGFAILPRKTVINNVKFDPWPGAPSFTAISMDYNAQSTSLISLDQVFVYNYNQVQGNNFQVYYTQQQANFVVPQTMLNPNDPSRVWITASPEAGLTNAQNWARYGIAIAGAIAPANTTTQSEINGLIGPITGG